MYKVVFRIKDCNTGKVSTTISSGYVDTRVEALTYANAIKTNHDMENKGKYVIDFHVIGIGGLKR